MKLPPRANSPLLPLLAVGIAAFLGAALLLFTLYNTQEDLSAMRLALLSLNLDNESESYALYAEEREILFGKVEDGSLEHAMRLREPPVSASQIVEAISAGALDQSETLGALEAWVHGYARLHSRASTILLSLLLLTSLILFLLLWSTGRSFSRLEGEMRASDAMASRIASAQESERLRVSQELHDGAGPALSLALLHLKRDDAPEPIVQATIAVEEALGTIRSISSRLRPPAPSISQDLATAIGELAARFNAAEGVEVECLVLGLRNRRFPQQFVLQLYRIAQELLTNGVRHARASRIEVRLVSAHPELRLTYKDDGVGLSEAEWVKPTGSGLLTVWDRLRLLDGDMQRLSGPGTRLDIHIPLPEEA